MEGLLRARSGLIVRLGEGPNPSSKNENHPNIDPKQ